MTAITETTPDELASTDTHGGAGWREFTDRDELQAVIRAGLTDSADPGW